MLRSLCLVARGRVFSIRNFSSTPTRSKELSSPKDISEFLSESSWSVRSLLPNDDQIASSDEVTPAQLRHLLRLSALPPPSSPAEEKTMLRDLHAQLHFVKQIQSVDTDGVKPLRSLRDETAEGQKANELGLEAMKDALAMEEVVGKYNRRIRRKKVDDPEAAAAENWNILGQAKRKVGAYFVVERKEEG